MVGPGPLLSLDGELGALGKTARGVSFAQVSQQKQTENPNQLFTQASLGEEEGKRKTSAPRILSRHSSQEYSVAVKLSQCSVLS